MAAAPSALDDEPRTWLGKKWQELKDGLDPGEVIGLEVAVTVFTWLFCGVVFFYVSEKNVDHKFDDMTGNVIFYTIYFCVNVGLGVGSAPMKPSSWFERIGCAVFCFAGNCLIVGGVGVYYGASSQRVLKRLAMGDEGEEEHIRRLQLVVRGGGFCGLVASRRSRARIAPRASIFVEDPSTVDPRKPSSANWSLGWHAATRSVRQSASKS